MILEKTCNERRNKTGWFIDADGGLVETGSGRAADCISCGQCESVCPQHLPVIRLLKEAAEKLDV